jgi:hypothetical protein
MWPELLWEVELLGPAYPPLGYLLSAIVPPIGPLFLVKTLVKINFCDLCAAVNECACYDC